MWKLRGRAGAAAGLFLALVAALSLIDGRSLAADVEITSNSGSVDLNAQSGSTAHVVPGVTVTGNITATNSAWTLTNDGTVNGSNAVKLTAGGTVNNSAGATVTATFSAVTLGNNATGGVGTVVNGGTLSGGSVGDAVALYGGGTVTNLVGGQITSTSTSNAVSLSGGTSRVVVNSGSISNTGSNYATGVLIQGGAGSITNNAGGTIYGGYNGIYMSASAPLTLINDGSITSTRGAAVEMGGGGTVINTGTVSSPFDGFKIAGAATATNTGTIQSTGSGRSIAFSGGAVHTLNLGTGSVLTGNVQGGTGTDNLVLTGTGTESAAKFLAFETLAMQGTDWTLTGNGTFTASASVDSGRLAVNGTLTTGTFSILSGGILGGSGTVAGAVTNGGTIAPGNSIGTLTVSSILFSPNSLYSVEIDPASADKLQVTGTATLDTTAKVSVSAAPGTYTNGTSYLILDTVTLSGTFGGVVDNSAFLDFTLDYAQDPNQVWLTITNAADFASVAETLNQRAAAGGAQDLGSGNAVYDAVAALDAASAREAFDMLSGEIHAGAKGALLDDSRFLREAALDRFTSEFVPASQEAATLAYAPTDSATATVSWPDRATSSHPFNGWAQAFGSGATFSGDDNAADLDRSIGGFLAGGDWIGEGGWRFGLATGVEATSLDEPARGSTASIRSYDLAAYGGFEGDAFKARAGAAISWHDLSTRRDVSFPGFSDVATADYGARTTQLFGELARPIRLGDMELEPFAGAAWVRLDVDGFTESGGAAALSSPASHADTALTTLGVRFDKPLGRFPARLTGAVAWQHAFGAHPATSDLAFAGGTPFTIAGTARGADVLKLDIGLGVPLGKQARASLGYSGEIGDGVSDHALTGRLAVAF